MSHNQKSSFVIGDYVVYIDGIGQVTNINPFGKSITLSVVCVTDFATNSVTGNNLDLQNNSHNVRPVVSYETVARALEIISAPSTNLLSGLKRLDSDKLIKELRGGVEQGDFLTLAKIIRDFYPNEQDNTHPLVKRNLYEEAARKMFPEIATALNIDLEAVPKFLQTETGKRFVLPPPRIKKSHRARRRPAALTSFEDFLKDGKS